ncbi:unnamed protein product [Brassica rapa subsp. trilocularis]
MFSRHSIHADSDKIVIKVVFQSRFGKLPQIMTLMVFGLNLVWSLLFRIRPRYISDFFLCFTMMCLSTNEKLNLNTYTAFLKNISCFEIFQWLERRTQEFEPTYLYTMENLKFWFDLTVALPYFYIGLLFAA